MFDGVFEYVGDGFKFVSNLTGVSALRRYIIRF